MLGSPQSLLKTLDFAAFNDLLILTVFICPHGQLQVVNYTVPSAKCIM